MRRPGTDRPGWCQGSMLPLRSGSGSQPGLILASGSDDSPVIFAPGQPVTRGAANGVLPAEGAPAPPLIRSGRAGGVSKRELSAAVDVAKQPYPDKRITLWFEDKARIGKIRRGLGRKAASTIAGGRAENSYLICATNVTPGFICSARCSWLPAGGSRW